MTDGIVDGTSADKRYHIVELSANKIQGKSENVLNGLLFLFATDIGHRAMHKIWSLTL